MPFGEVTKFRAKSCEREENAWVLGWRNSFPLDAACTVNYTFAYYCLLHTFAYYCLLHTIAYCILFSDTATWIQMGACSIWLAAEC